MVVEALSGVVSQGDGGGVREEESCESLGGGMRGDRNPRSLEHFQPNLRRFLNASFACEISPSTIFLGDALCPS